MGFNNENGLPVVFDIETCVHPDAAQYLPPPELEYLSAPKNYTKADSIEQWKADEKLRRVKAWEDDLERCALDPDLCRIVAIGFMGQQDEAPRALICRNEDYERDALAEFWKIVGRSSLIGYNCVSFDMPVLLRRSLLLGVKTPGFSISKYRHPGVVDLMKVLSFDGMLTWRKQSFYLKRFGLPVPADDITGADIAQLVHEEKWDAIEHHVTCDVLGAHKLAAHIGVIGRVAEAS